MNKLILTFALLAYAAHSQAQVWTTSPNPLSSPAPNPTDGLAGWVNNVQFLNLRPNGQFGLGTTAPRARFELSYCPLNNSPTSHDQPGLLVNRYECGIPGVGTSPVINPGNYGTTTGGGGGGTEPPFTVIAGSYLTIPFTNATTPLVNTSQQPLLWVRTEHQPVNVMGAPTSANYFETKLITLANGNTGINTTSPRAALDVRVDNEANKPAAIFGAIRPGSYTAGAGGILQYKTLHMAYYPRLNSDAFNKITQTGDQGLIFTDGGGTDGANVNGAFILAPWANNNNVAVGGLRMDNMGNVDIHGKLQATYIKVKPQWWADTVFHVSYSPMPLDSVAQFIQTNKHLPGIPSEQEVLTEGIDLADMQARQLKSMEELYLHIIALQEQIKAQQLTIEELKKAAATKN